MTDTSQPDDTDRTLHVYVDEAERLREQTKARLEAAENDEPIDHIGHTHVLNVDGKADLARLLSEKNVELLQAIRQHEPESMRATATIVDRDYKEVHRNLTELAELGVIDFERENQSKRPVARFDEIEVHLSLQESSRHEETSPA